ncbi:hypothetical protein C8Q76DRAFT_859167 [Earliella scabrosa]|nr:hypothetical protein C8Q76DRAFT_859167 [Earliella scabrosa]
MRSTGVLDSHTTCQPLHLSPTPSSCLSGTVNMFERVFKKRDDASYSDLSRRSRVDKRASRRPKTAPSSFSSIPERDATPSPRDRRSLQEESFRVTRSDSRHGFYIARGAEHSRSSTAIETRRPQLEENEHASRPSINRSASSASCEIRNPFRSRSNTTESVPTVTMSRSPTRESSVEAVQRMVPTYHARRIDGAASPAPHKAAIFTRSTVDTRQLDPFTDDNSEDSASPTTPSAESFSPPRPVASKRHPWSFLRSPKPSSNEFLKVNIPSGMFSPPTIREQRHSFWSRA